MQDYDFAFDFLMLKAKYALLTDKKDATKYLESVKKEITKIDQMEKESGSMKKAGETLKSMIKKIKNDVYNLV